MLRRDRIDDNQRLRVLVAVGDEGSHPPSDRINAVDPSIGQGGGCDGDTAAEDVHHVPRLVALGLGGLSVLVALDDGHDYVHSALRPAVRDDSAPECRLEVDAEVPLRRIT